MNLVTVEHKDLPKVFVDSNVINFMTPDTFSEFLSLMVRRHKNFLDKEFMRRFVMFTSDNNIATRHMCAGVYAVYKKGSSELLGRIIFEIE